MAKISSAFSTAAVILACASPALADEGVAETTERRGVHEHDGFYLRIATGFGGYSESITLEDSDDRTSVTGMASVGELALGGTVAPGIILGGGVWTSSVLASDRNVDGAPPPDEVIGGSGNFSLIGPFVDWYFDAHRGLHLQGALGFASVRGYGLPEAQDNPDAASLGGGFMVGFGYEWWASDQWSLGILARLAAVVAVQEDDEDQMWTHGIGTSPSVLFTATLN